MCASLLNRMRCIRSDERVKQIFAPSKRRAHLDTAPDFSLAPRGTSGERDGVRGDSGDRRPSSPQPSPPSEGGEGVPPSENGGSVKMRPKCKAAQPSRLRVDGASTP